MEVRPDNVLRCQEEHEEEGKVGAGVAYKFNKWLLDEQSQPALGRNQIGHRKHGEEQSDGDASQELHRPVLPSPSGETVVPQGRKQLLAVGLGDKLGINK